MSADTANPPSFSSVTSYLEWDHRRLDNLLESTRALVLLGHFSAAVTSYGQFLKGLTRHIRIEEEILFPIFEEHTGHSGPTQVMHHEHQLIHGALSAIGEAIDSQDPRRFEAEQRGLVHILSAHNMKEEHVLYPMTDESMSSSARAELVARLEGEPE
ncbi:MAG: hemerythrin domain-containing protein [Deltaproteobacteria bacterium]|nr:hemerythrin domain-containing protein [Deltaproteobacteria bacterium]